MNKCRHIHRKIIYGSAGIHCIGVGDAAYRMLLIDVVELYCDVILGCLCAVCHLYSDCVELGNPRGQGISHGIPFPASVIIQYGAGCDDT